MTKDEFKEHIANLSTDTLNLYLGMYTGPNRYLLREKKFGNISSKEFEKIIEDEILDRFISGSLND